MYVPFTLDMPMGHAAAMIHGGSIKIHPKQHSGHKVYVTKGQHARLMKSQKSGRSITLKMTPAQYKYNMKHGAGFWSDVFQKVKSGAQTAYNFVKPVIQPIVEKGVNRLVDAGANRIGKIADGYIDKGAQLISGDGLYNNPIYNTGPDRQRAGKKTAPQLYNNDVFLTGPQKRRGKKQPAVQLYNNEVYNTGEYRGEGFFDDIANGFKSVINTVAPIAVPIATNLIAKRFGGKVKKGKKKGGKKGGSFLTIGARP